MTKDNLSEFVQFAMKLKGDEKGEAQLFCDRLFRAFGHGGIVEANGALEARIKFSSGQTKFADCLWSPPGRNGVLIEMKKRSEKNLENHFSQVRDYWIEMNPERVIGPGAQKPTYIILCNFDRFLIYKHLFLVDDVKLTDFVDRASAFSFLLIEEKEPIFDNNVEAISQDAAKLVGSLFKYLVYERKESAEVAQRFLLQCILSLFSEDFDLLPKDMFSEVIRDCKTGQNSYDLIGGLFKQMSNPTRAKGGRFKEVKYFNGGLFKNIEPIELDLECLNILEDASKFNWRYVNPAIFGALFEGTMSSNERHKYGAHFTSEVDIQKIVNPTIIRPWKNSINEAKTLTELKALLEKIESYKVLDPACGCGNFLYVAYRALKDIEMLIIEKIANNFSLRSITPLALGISRVNTKNFIGIDVLPIAVEVAKMTMMIAKEVSANDWNNRISPLMSSLSLSFDEGLPLDSLDDCIVNKDSLLSEWPEVDVIIGNPPYQSKNKMQQELDPIYLEKVRKQYPGVPGRADYCVYWFRRTHDELKHGQRAGLVGTNTIRENYSREGGLDYIVNNGGTILEAVSSQVWSGDANVNVSIVNWIKGECDDEKLLSIQNGDSVNSTFNYYHLEKINSSLSCNIDVSKAKSLEINKKSKCCYQGQTHGHEAFLVSENDAIRYIKSNPKYKEVLFPFLTAEELIGKNNSLPQRFVIDFRKFDIFSASKYTDLFDILKKSVYEERKNKAEQEEQKNKETLAENSKIRVNHHHSNFFKYWWKLSYTRDELMDLLEKEHRYCVCSQHTKRPIFEFISSEIHPNAALVVFPLSDDYSFGILQSTMHWEWFKARGSTLVGRYRYTSDTIFDSYPWPQNLDLQNVRDIARFAVSLRQERKEVMQRNKLSFRELYRMMEETPNNSVSNIQKDLDKAVFKAYGYNSKGAILSYLLELNRKIYEKEKNGEKVLGPGLPDFVTNKDEFSSKDCIQWPEE